MRQRSILIVLNAIYRDSGRKDLLQEKGAASTSCVWRIGILLGYEEKGRILAVVVFHPFAEFTGSVPKQEFLLSSKPARGLWAFISRSSSCVGKVVEGCRRIFLLFFDRFKTGNSRFWRSHWLSDRDKNLTVFEAHFQGFTMV